MLSAKKLARILSDVMLIHSEFARTPEKAFRRFDGVTPFGIHPVMGGLLILHEENLREKKRVTMATAFFGHDFKEDTTKRLPAWARKPEVKKLILGMTFKKGEDKFVEVWNRGNSVILLSFYDNVLNLMCAKKMKAERRAEYRKQVRRQLVYLEPRYPRLEIFKIAKGFVILG